MPTPAERQAFLYLALVTALGTAVRAWDGRVAGPSPTEAHALAVQLAAVDSALAGRGAPAAPRGGAVSDGGRPTPGSTVRRAESRSAAGSAPSQPGPVGPIDVDRADAATLERLPGIGPALAARIIADRDSLGPFGSAEGLQRVRGIGPAMRRRLGGLVTFSGVPRPGGGASSSRGSRRSP